MQPTKATIKNLDTGEVIRCLFNPSEYTIQKANNWEAKPIVGTNVPELDFTGGGSRTMTVELLLDVYEEPGADVRTHVDRLWKLTLINAEKKNPVTNRSRPPLCLFQWGGNWGFKAAVTNLSVRYVLFREDGTPVRAIANVSFQEAEDDSKQKGTNPTSFTPPGYKRREIRPYDTLAGIAYEEYGDPNYWRRIADANALDDPMSLEAGDTLMIPPL